MNSKRRFPRSLITWSQFWKVKLYFLSIYFRNTYMYAYYIQRRRFTNTSSKTSTNVTSNRGSLRVKRTVIGVLILRVHSEA